jgi:tetratricopeptide (TPR) repeat protein
MAIRKSQPRRPESRIDRRTLIAASVLCLLSLLAYANSFTAGFPLDNKGLIPDDTRIRDLTSRNLDLIVHHTYWWPVGESGLYRPFTTFSYLFNYAILGNAANPAGYHWINLLLHAGNVILLWTLARRFTREFWPPFWIAAVWAVHPVLTESVTNIVGRADLLAGIALLGGLLLYLDQRLWTIAPLFVLTLVGVFSKESAVTVAGVILLYELAFPSPGIRRRLPRMLAVLVPIVLMLIQRAAVLAASAPTQFPFTDNPLVAAPFWPARFTALTVIARYLVLLLWAATLSCDYSYAQIPVATGTPLEWLAAAIAILTVIAILLLYRWNRAAFFAGASALLVFLPTSNLLFPFGAIMAERFLYLPSIAIAALIVGLAYRLPKYAPGLLCLIVAAFGLRTFARNADWQDDLSLSASAVQTAPRSFKSHLLRANALLASNPSHANIDAVIDESGKALAILDPLPDRLNVYDPYQRAAEYHFMRGDLHRRRAPDGSWIVPPESTADWNRALQLLGRAEKIAETSHAAWQQQRAKLYLRLNQTQPALDAALKARALDPSDPESSRVLAGILIGAGRAQDALLAVAEGVLLTGDPALQRTLATLYTGGLDPQGCALRPSGELNPACDTVRRDFCASVPDAIRLRSDSGRADLAEELKRTAARDFGCP